MKFYLSIYKIITVLTFNSLSFWDLLQFGIPFSPSQPASFFVCILTFSPLFTPIFHHTLPPSACCLGYALLTHCDPSALWTACLPTDNHMLSQPSPGKPSTICCQNSYFLFVVCVIAERIYSTCILREKLVYVEAHSEA